jgi:cytochrome P450
MLPTSPPRASHAERFGVDPFEFLAHNRKVHGNVFAIPTSGPIFSRASDCSAVVAVFGSEHHRAVLGDIESFGMPESAARVIGLPATLVNLNRGLHSMPPDRHAAHKPLLTRSLGMACVEPHHESVWASLAKHAETWPVGSPTGLLALMREAVLRASAPVLFGGGHGQYARLARLLQTYFHLRREASSPLTEEGTPSRSDLVAVGTSLDTELRTRVREWCRSADSPAGLLTRLSRLGLGPEALMTEDEVVGHANVLCVSSTEPVAVALAWILLVLSQLPDLRDELRAEIGTGVGTGIPQLSRLRLVNRVVAECLRLLPPNAFMVRITTRPTSLDGVELPRRCEVIVCPFLAHRAPETFPRPAAFSPARWKGPSPSPFDYLPFGGGGHSCAGRALGMYLIKATLVFVLSRYDVLLAGDQEIDWRQHIQFMPRSDPAVTVHPVDEPSPRQGGKLSGPVGALLDLE